MATRRRKVRKMRGSRTHGWGTSGQHRKSGMLGGHGTAGQLKRRALMLEKGKLRGKLGFRSISHPVRTRIINVGELHDVARQLTSEASRGNRIAAEIDLTKLGISKLLGSGTVDRAFQIKVEKCSASARQKIEEAGGKVLAEQPATKG